VYIGVPLARKNSNIFIKKGRDRVNVSTMCKGVMSLSIINVRAFQFNGKIFFVVIFKVVILLPFCFQTSHDLIGF